MCVGVGRWGFVEEIRVELYLERLLGNELEVDGEGMVGKIEYFK